MKKKCTKCKEEKDLSFFHGSKSSIDGVRWACKSCTNSLYRSTYRLSHKLLFGTNKNCLDCKKVFIVKAFSHVRCLDCSELREGQAKKSWAERNKKKTNERRKQRLFEKGESIICLDCKRNFVQPKYSKQLFCSRACSANNSRVKRRGEGNPAYRNGLYSGGKKPYWGVADKNFDFKAKEIKEKMVEEFGYIFCMLCGVNQALRWEVHHIVFRSEAPAHVNLHNERNLILLCIRCHNNLHSQKSRRNTLVKERRLWELFPEYLQEGSFA